MPALSRLVFLSSASPYLGTLTHRSRAATSKTNPSCVARPVLPHRFQASFCRCLNAINSSRPGARSREGAEGRDCSAIEGADSVSCDAGSCNVQSCLQGWALNETGDACVKVEERTPASRAFGVVAHALERSRLVVRAPHGADRAALKPQPDPKFEGDDGVEGEGRDDSYNNAWFRL